MNGSCGFINCATRTLVPVVGCVHIRNVVSVLCLFKILSASRTFVPVVSIVYRNCLCLCVIGWINVAVARLTFLTLLLFSTRSSSACMLFSCSAYLGRTFGAYLPVLCAVCFVSALRCMLSPCSAYFLGTYWAYLPVVCFACFVSALRSMRCGIVSGCPAIVTRCIAVAVISVSMQLIGLVTVFIVFAALYKLKSTIICSCRGSFIGANHRHCKILTVSTLIEGYRRVVIIIGYKTIKSSTGVLCDNLAAVHRYFNNSITIPSWIIPSCVHDFCHWSCIGEIEFAIVKGYVVSKTLAVLQIRTREVIVSKEVSCSCSFDIGEINVIKIQIIILIGGFIRSICIGSVIATKAKQRTVIRQNNVSVIEFKGSIISIGTLG